MKKQIDIYRAWRDGEYYLSLSEEDRARVPEGPLGAIQLSDEELRAANGLVTLDTHQSWCYNSACITHCSCLC
jgi:mersacidin/lichenicidin family type 2 lantibiotic